MSNFKFAPDLFLEVAELNRFQKFLDTDGFRKNILENSIKFGLIKNNADTSFANGLVQRDVDSISGDKTIKINPLYAIDSNGQFVYSPNTISQIPLTDDNNWYWLKVKYATTNEESGTLSIAVNGDCVGTGTEFTKILRGQPNFPSKIKLLNSTYNTLEYEVLEVIDDTHMTLSNPSVNIGGLAEFSVESNLTYGVVGTFTPGVSIPSGNKYPFQYDSISYELIQETTLNTRPAYVSGQEFYISRIKVNGSNVIIQDKRIEYWETKGSELAINLDRNTNNLVGVESIKWQVAYNPADKNLVQVGWGMRSDNWTVNSSQNLLVLNSGLGGKYKTVNDFNNGDFNGWRVYTSNGTYSNVISSIKQGGAINLTLDVLDVDNYSTDGGSTFITQTVSVVPNCESVEFLCQSEPTDTTPSVNKEVSFPVNSGYANIELEVYKSTSVLYNVQYRYKSLKEYTEWTPLPSDTVGYLQEISFDEFGNLKPLTDQVRFPTTSSAISGFISLQICPWAYVNFKGQIYKGDLIGVNTITSLSSLSTYNLKVGTAKNYQYITGALSVGGDVFFNLDTAGAVEGNEFRIHFNCSSLNLAGNHIFITSGLGSGGTATTLKEIGVADVYSMLNEDNGICFTCKYTGSQWVCYQNYDIGQPYEVKMAKVDPNTVFDTNGYGKIKGWYGWQWMNGLNGTTNMQGRTAIGHGIYTESGVPTTYNVGDQLGEKNHTLVESEIPKITPTATVDPHSHNVPVPAKASASTGGGAISDGTDDGQPTVVNVTSDNATVNVTIDEIGGDNAHNNMQPSTVLIFAQRLF